VSRVAVVGAGTMGNGIAHVFAQAGWETVLIDSSADAIARGMATIDKNTERQASKGVITASERRELLARLKTSTSLEAAKGAEMVVEAATENPEIKFHLVYLYHRDRQAHRPPSQRHRHAFHESSTSNETGRSDSWERDVERHR
jgi:3-hydroxyacyl-CoA dehydrogenase